MKRTIRLIVISVSIFSSVIISPAQQSVRGSSAPVKDRRIAAWVRRNAVPLDGDYSKRSGMDLESFGKMISDARVVGLGEGTHGTSEFFKIKHRFIRYLIERQNFNVIAFEANFAAVTKLNEYILYGRGTAEEALNATGSWGRDTEEILEFMKWLREFNTDPVHQRKVSIYGIDVLNIYPEINAALQFIGKTDAPRAETFRQAFLTIHNFAASKLGDTQERFDSLYPGLTQSDADLLLEAVDQMAEYLDINRATLVAASPPNDWEDARQHAAVAHERGENLVWLTRWFGSKGQTEEVALWRRTAQASSQLLDFFQKTDRAFAETTRPLLAALKNPYATIRTYRNRLTPNDRSAWLETTARMIARLQIRHSQYSQLTSEDAWQQAVKNADNVRELLNVFGEYLSKSDKWWADPRDLALADNVEWLLKRDEQNKVIVWAHNLHVSEAESDGVLGPMGNELRKRLGEGYKNVGMIFNKGAFQAAVTPEPPPGSTEKPVQRFEVDNAIEGSVEATFARADLPQFLLDLRKVPDKGEIADWFSKGHPARTIGRTFSPSKERDYYDELTLLQAYDMVVFVNMTTRAIPTKLAQERFGVGF